MKVFAALQLSKGSAIPIQKLSPLHVAEQVVNGGWYDPHGGSDFSLASSAGRRNPKGIPLGRVILQQAPNAPGARRHPRRRAVRAIADRRWKSTENTS